MKTEFESRIEFHRIKLRSYKKPVFEATVYWNGQLHETIKASKEACIEDLKQKANVKE